jgi:hypothetical protein
MKRFVPILLVLFFLPFALLSCSTVSAKTKHYPGAPSPSPTNPATVEILRSEPERPYEKLGEVRVEAEGNPPAAMIENKLKLAAAGMGADAVIIVDRKTERVASPPSGCGHGGYVQNVETIRGIAVRYSG